MAATIKDVAKATRLSIATISKFINGGNVLEGNKLLIENAIKELDFKVNSIARGLKTSKTMTIGVLIPDLKNIFCTTIVSNIENTLSRSGYSTMICDYNHSPVQEKEKLRFLVEKQVDGIITMPQDGWAQGVQELFSRNIPVVFIDRAIKGIECDAVLVDNLNASYNAVETLLTKGHRRVGIICGPDEIFTAQERLKGYYNVHEDYRVPVDAALVKKGDYEMESGYLLLNELLDLPNPPTAVFVTNYEMTLGAVMAINERNIRMPDELSFIGFDNLQMARVVKPALSIVVQPMECIGETAANVLLRRMRDDMSGFPSMFRLKTELIEGNSVSRLMS